MSRTDRVIVIVSLVTLGLTISLLIPLPGLEIKLPLGSDLVLKLSGATQLAIILSALVFVGVQSGIRAHPPFRAASLAYTMTFGALPALLTIVILIFLHGLAWWGYRIVLIGLGAAALGAVIAFQYRSLDVVEDRRARARICLNITAYVVALILYVALYGLRLRSLFSATAVLAVSGLLALGLLRDGGQDIGRTWLYAGIIALAMGELTWALSYCSIDARLGGYLLLLLFYLLTGLSQQYLRGRLRRGLVIEYALVGAASLAALWVVGQYVGVGSGL